jgi:hypothetical protein
MHPAGLGTTVPARSDNSAPRAGPDSYAHDLALAQVEALDRAYAGLERRLERIAVLLGVVEGSGAPVVSPGQLRLVVGGP